MVLSDVPSPLYYTIANFGNQGIDLAYYQL